MRKQSYNTLQRLRSDLRRSIHAISADVAFGYVQPDCGVAKRLYDRTDRIVEALVEDLRRNWTITDRARPSRGVPKA